MIARFPWNTKLYGFAEPMQALSKTVWRARLFLMFIGAIAIPHNAKPRGYTVSDV
jgi:hypothetical protein